MGEVGVNLTGFALDGLRNVITEQSIPGAVPQHPVGVFDPTLPANHWSLIPINDVMAFAGPVNNILTDVAEVAPYAEVSLVSIVSDIECNTPDCGVLEEILQSSTHAIVICCSRLAEVS